MKQERTMYLLLAIVVSILLTTIESIDAAPKVSSQTPLVHFCKGFAGNFYSITFEQCQSCCSHFMKGSKAAYVRKEKCFCQEQSSA